MMRLKCGNVRYNSYGIHGSAIETSQLERRIPISIRPVYLSRTRTTYAGSYASSFFTHQRAAVPVSTVEVIEGQILRTHTPCMVKSINHIAPTPLRQSCGQLTILMRSSGLDNLRHDRNGRRWKTLGFQGHTEPVYTHNLQG